MDHHSTIEDILPLAPLQQGMLFQTLRDPGSPVFFVQVRILLEGPLDVEKLQSQWRRAIARHGALRASIHWEQLEKPYQVIHRAVEAPWEMHDWRGSPAQDVEGRLARHLEQDRKNPLVLDRAPLMRFQLIRLEDDVTQFVWSIHHILLDGWSMNIVLREALSDFSGATGNGARHATYRDYFLYLQSKDEADQERYWRERLAGFHTPTPLGEDRPADGSAVDRELASELLELSAKASGELRQAGLRNRLTVGTIIQGAWALLLSKRSGEEDVVWGTVVSGRPDDLDGVEHTVGLLINTLPARTALDPKRTVFDWLSELQRQLAADREHQYAPLTSIQGWSEIERGQRLFRSIVVVENHPVDSGAKLAPGVSIGGASLFDQSNDPLNLKVYPGQNTTLELLYDEACFDRATALDILQRIRILIEAIVARPNSRLDELPVLTEPERVHIVEELNKTAEPYLEQCVHVTFERHALERGDASCLSFGNERLSYREVNRRANRLANRLFAEGVGAGDLVGLCVEPSSAMVTGMLAILKAGAAFLPLDPEYPRDRLRYMVDDAGLAYVLTDAASTGRLPADFAARILVDGSEESGDDANPSPRSSLDDLAYVIYTSGSTGQPKGALLEHRGLANVCDAQKRMFGVEPSSRVLQFSSLSFDASVFQIVMALRAGAKLCIAPPEARYPGAELLELLEREQISIVTVPPSVLAALPDRELPDLRVITVAGEACPAELVRRWAGGRRFFNLYGPTETTIWATAQECNPRDEPPSIGRPIPNLRAYVLDRWMQPVPFGSPGELCIGGVGVGRGYWNRPELTAERFLPNPFEEDSSGRLYRTGDLVRMRQDGEIEFLGRVDDQVKVRGFRIEPGEIQAQIERLEGVAECAVLARDSGDSSKQVVAYVVPRNGNQLREAAVKDELRRTLPAYMIPERVLFLESMPLTLNGKIDRKRLPSPSQTDANSSFAKGRSTEPASEVEKKIAEAWRKVLAAEHVGRDDNFFDLGGHSLHLVRLQSELREALEKPDLSIVELFQYPTVRMLARHVKGEEAQTRPAVTADAEGPRHSTSQPIAVIGMAGRFPGAKTLDELWENLKEGVDVFTRFSEEELREAGVPDSVASDPAFVNRGVVVEDAAGFDNRFFGMTAREAEITDPQHRLMLECAWHALESAGYDPFTYQGAIGVYAGAAMSTYLTTHVVGNPEAVAASGALQVTIGNDKDSLPLRISYKLNLRGPSVNVQTACSTSLVAIHMACEALRAGDCDMALAGGVSLQFPEKTGYTFQQEGILSSDGKCRTFDAAASGTVPGCGAGIVVIKPLDRALADGDRIEAVILGSSTNNDGAGKVGFTAPSVEGQEQVIAAAQAAAGVDAGTISYIEAHGTATPLGDPVEVEALTRAFRRSTEAAGFCAIASIKSNLGHLNPAAGVAGLIKTILQLRHRTLAPNLHFESPNPRIDFDRSPFYINDRLRPWESDGPRRAGVSSFGMGGTNAHLILEEAPATLPVETGDRPQTIVLSANTREALQGTAGNLAAHLRNAPAPLADLAHTLQTGRAALPWRHAFVAGNHDDAVRTLEQFDAARIDGPSNRSGVAFLFPGQGAQRPNMARGLYEANETFRSTLDRLSGLFEPELHAPLVDLLYPPAGKEDAAAAKLTETYLAQPVLFAVEYALARTWMSCGITPEALLGHSIGEYVAACLAGVFSLEDAVRAVALRGRLMQRMAPGCMLSVALPEADIEQALPPALSLAAVNAPELCVVSGPESAIDDYEASLTARGVECRRLRTSHAFHSAAMEPMLQELEAAFRRLELNAPVVPFVSNLTGEWIEDEQAVDPAYWAAHLRHTVRFSDGVRTIAVPERLLIEVGPGRALSSLAKLQPGAESVPSLDLRGGERSDERAFQEAVAFAWAHGISVDWSALQPTATARRIELPPYPFEHRTFLLPRAPAASRATDAVDARRNPISDWFYAPAWKPAPLATAPAEDETKWSWLLFSDGGELSTAVMQWLTERGETFAALEKQDLEELDDRIASMGDGPLRVVHFWNCAVEPSSAAQIESSYHSLIDLAQALGLRPSEAPVELTIVGSAMLSVIDGEPVVPEKALSAGPCLVIPREYPHVACRVVDFNASGARSIENLTAELLHSPTADHVAFRGRQRLERHFESVALGEHGKAARLRRKGVYVITGGFGGVGFEIARSLAESVQARLVLMGRNPLPADSEAIRSLEEMGAEVLALGVDVSDRPAVRGAIARALDRFGEVHGVVHAAGIAGGGLIANQTRDAATRVFAAKVAGTKNLDVALAGRNLDFFVLFSSLRSILGAPGRVEYCAANAFLDAFAASRSSVPACICSIAWDTWKDVGMAAGGDETAAEIIEGAGSSAMSNREGAEAFRRLLDCGLPLAIVSTQSLEFRIREHRRLTMDSLLEQASAETAPSAPAHPRPELASVFREPETDREAALAGIWCRLLGIDRVGVDDNFFELGGDSVVIIQMIALARKTGLQLTARQVFANPTIAALAAAADAQGADVAPEKATGPAPLAPIQSWFFDRSFTDANHFNQSVLLEASRPLEPRAVRAAVDALMRAHEALRLRFFPKDEGWLQQDAGDAAQAQVDFVDLSSASDDAAALEIEASAARAQKSLDFRQGPVFRAVAFDMGSARPSRLLFVAHHLTIDFVSWRILLEDFQTAYELAQAGRTITLPDALPFTSWARALAQSSAPDKVHAQPDSLPLDHPEADVPSTRADAASARWTLDEQESAVLVRELPRTRRAPLHRALLTALLGCYRSWSGRESLYVDIELMGRDRMPELDVSRTVGWFTDLSPTRVDAASGLDPLDMLESLQESRAEGVQPQISFLYQGQMDRAMPGEGLLRPARESAGSDVSPRGELPHLLAISCVVLEGRLQTEWTWSGLHWDRATIERVGEDFVRQLRELARACRRSTTEAPLRSAAAAFPRIAAELQQVRLAVELQLGGQSIEHLYPLSPMQQGMLFHTLAQPELQEYFRQVCVPVQGDLDIEKFRAAWENVIERHEVLRSVFLWRDDMEPVQAVVSQCGDWWNVVERPASIEAFLEEDRNKGFDLTTPPLQRFTLLVGADNDYHFVWSFHHLLLDGWSATRVMSEVMAVYDALSDGREIQPVPAAPFRLFIEWLAGQDRQQAETFWRSYLQGFRSPSSLAIEAPAGRKPLAKSYRETVRSVDAAAVDAWREFARKNQLTLNTLMQGAWAMLLGRYSGEDDVVFGATASVRPPEISGVESMIGLLINTLPVRVPLDGSQEVGEWLRRLQREQAELREFSYSALLDVHGWSEVPRSRSLFESIVVFENYPVSDAVTGATSSLTFGDGESFERTNFPLTLLVSFGRQVRLLVDYDASRFDGGAIAAMLDHYVALLESLTRDAAQRLDEVSLLSAEEADRVVVDWNRTDLAIDREATIQGLFRKQALAGPDRVAVVCGEEHLSYRKLDSLSDRIAAALRLHGVQPGARVGVCLNRSVRMVAALLGTLKTGSAYVPLDPSFPKDRLAFMAEDAEIEVLITEAELRTTAEGFRRAVLDLDDPLPSQELAQGRIAGGADDLAYVIYTSGSTGKPKGVMIPHRAVVNFLESMRLQPGLQQDDRLLAVTTLSFDIAVLELYLPLLVGAKVVLATREQTLDGRELARLLAAERITAMQATPAGWRLLLESGWEGQSGLKALCGGEALAGELAQRLVERCGQVWNLYGPTETTVWSTLEQVESGEAVTIGRPIANTQVYVLDGGRRPVGVGVAGELWIGGEGLARGYWRREELTAERFVENPFRAGERMYRTGDVGRWRRDGRLECLGRVDQQVKVRGHRIELGEIEARLEEVEGVAQAAVRAWGQGPETRLAAYVRAEAGSGKLEVGRLRERLRASLPEYMVPGAWVELEEFPLTPNGKVNRGALEEPGEAAELGEQRAYVAPRGEWERLVAAVWSEVLGREKIGAEENFFELGGHSLLMAQVHSRLRDRAPRQLTIVELFQNPTVAGTARLLSEPWGEQGEGAQRLERIERRGGSGPARLSYGQQRLWFLEEWNKGAAGYNLWAGVRLRGPLSEQRLREALERLSERHELLRTVYRMTAEGPRQQVLEGGGIEVRVEDWQAESGDREERLRAYVSERMVEPFDLERGPVARALLVRLGEREHALSLTLHHIVADAWGLQVLFRDLAAIYEGLEQGKEAELEELEIEYGDYAEWQRERLEGEQGERQLAYWRERLAGMSATELPADKRRPATQSYAGAVRRGRIGAATMERVRAAARAAGATTFMALAAGLDGVLARRVGAEEIVLGTQIAGRVRAETEALAGLFTNTLVLRTDVSGDPSFEELLERVRETALGAYGHQETPFEKLVEELEPRRDPSRPPLVQVMLLMQNQPVRGPEKLGEARLEPLEAEGRRARLDVTLEALEQGGELHYALEYNTDLYEEETIARLGESLERALEQWGREPGKRLSELELWSEEELERVVREWNASEAEYERELCVHEGIERQAAGGGERMALEGGGERLSYGELNERANRLAHLLIERGVVPEARVAVCLERGPRLVEALLGVWKAGGAYVPLDPDYPGARLELMLEDAEAALVLSERGLAGRLAVEPERLLLLDELELGGYSGANPGRRAGAENLAYMIYTSGSTGRPKAVTIEHRAVMNFLESMRRAPGLGPEDALLAVTTISFDIAVLELYLPLMVGAKVVLATREQTLDGRELARLLAAERITVMQATPAGWRLLLESGWEGQSGLKALCGGEALAGELAQRLVERCGQVWNLYGPTETTVWSTLEQVESGEAVTIGRPIANTQVYVLDGGRRPVGVGVAGELWIGGEGLARGYWRREELTAERFVENPFRAGERMYRTGDVGRWRRDGRLECLGRVDQQVKVRGHRIELGEIEARLEEVEGVAQAAVRAWGQGPETRLAAYVRAEAGSGKLEVGRLRERLRASLPEYMVPGAWVELEEFPLTPNGKVNRGALEEPGEAAELGEQREYVAPRGEWERLVAAVWSEVLGREKIGAEENFFELGGHSLLMAQVHSRLRDRAPRQLTIVDLFRHPTVASLAEFMEQGRIDMKGAAASTAAQERANRRLAAARRRNVSGRTG